MNSYNGNCLIIRGRVMNENLISYGLNKKELDKHLKSRNIESIEEVQYAEILIDGNLYIETKDSIQGSSCFICV